MIKSFIESDKYEPDFVRDFTSEATMCSYICIIFGLLIVSATGFQVLQELNIFEVLQNGMNLSPGAKSTECDEAVKKLDIGKDWTRAMFDATSKLQSGILAGNAYELGAFDECLAIDDIVDEVKGKYCLGTIQISTSTTFSQLYGIRSEYNKTGREDVPASLALRWSICIPEACTAADLNNVLQKSNMGFLNFEEADCQTMATQPSLNTGDYWAIALFAIIGFIMLLSTLYDISLYYQEKKTPYPSLLAFSVFTNGKKLFQVVDNPNNLQCVAGLRSISMMWVVLAHIVIYHVMVPGTNMVEMVEWYLSPESMYVAAATVSVDTFFLLGGMVMIYVYLGTKSDFRYYNVPAYYLHRYLRLTPVLAVVVLINATLLDNVGSGPLWTSPGNIVPMDYCKEYWWSTLLYVQNYVNIEKMCIAVSWYLSLDMQLFIISPLILIPLKKYPKSTLTAVVLLACGSVGSAAYSCWYYKINALNLAANDPNWFPKYYAVVWTRAAPWFIGIILGYYVYQVKNVRSIKLDKLLVFILWIASLTVLCVCVFCGNEIMTTQKDNLAATTMYSSLVRPAWAIALSWVVFACVSGYGGPINAFLSLPIFQILGRVSYCIYLTHYNILSSVTFSTRVPFRFSTVSIMLSFWSYFMVTFFVSVVFTLAFESPIIIIEKSIKNRGKTATAQPLVNVAKVQPQV